MPTLAQIRDAADTWLAARWPTVQARQATYAANHNGRYFQGRITHGLVPVDSVDSAADRLSDHPTDQPESWSNAIAGLPVNWPLALVMDVYRGPEGWGYCATVYVRVSANGKTYTRSQNVGSESWRTKGWTEVVPFVP